MKKSRDSLGRVGTSQKTALKCKEAGDGLSEVRLALCCWPIVTAPTSCAMGVFDTAPSGQGLGELQCPLFLSIWHKLESAGKRDPQLINASTWLACGHTCGDLCHHWADVLGCGCIRKQAEQALGDKPEQCLSMVSAAVLPSRVLTSCSDQVWPGSVRCNWLFSPKLL